MVLADMAKRSAGNEMHAYLCLSSSVCPPAEITVERDTCPPNSFGVACGNCETGYFLSHTTGCSECGILSGEAGLAFVVPMLCFLWGSLYWFSCPTHVPPQFIKSSFSSSGTTTGKNEHEESQSSYEFSSYVQSEEIHLRVVSIKLSTSVSFLIGNLQTFWTVASLSEVQDQLTKKFMQAPGGALTFSGIMDPACFGDKNKDVRSTTGTADAAFSRTILANLMPAFPILAIFMNALFTRFVLTKTRMMNAFGEVRGLEYWWLYRPQFVLGLSFILILFETFFLGIATNCFSITFAVYEHPPPLGPDRNSLLYFPGLLDTDPVRQKMAIVSIAATVVWCLGYGIVMVYLFWRANSKGGVRKSIFLGRLLLPNLARFEDEYYTYGFMILLRRLCLAIIGILRISRGWQLVLVCCVLVLSSFHVLYARPYRFNIFLKCDVFPMLVQVVCICALLNAENMSNKIQAVNGVEMNNVANSDINIIEGAAVDKTVFSSSSNNYTTNTTQEQAQEHGQNKDQGTLIFVVALVTLTHLYAFLWILGAGLAYWRFAMLVQTKRSQGIEGAGESEDVGTNGRVTANGTQQGHLPHQARLGVPGSTSEDSFNERRSRGSFVARASGALQNRITKLLDTPKLTMRMQESYDENVVYLISAITQADIIRQRVGGPSSGSGGGAGNSHGAHAMEADIRNVLYRSIPYLLSQFVFAVTKYFNFLFRKTHQHHNYHKIKLPGS